MLVHLLLDHVECIHLFRALSRSSCCQTCETRIEFALHRLFCCFPVLLEIDIPSFGELGTWFIHRSSFNYKTESEKTWTPGSCIFANSPSKKSNCLTNTLYSQDQRRGVNLKEISLRSLIDEISCKKISLALSTSKLTIAQMLQNHVIIQNANILDMIRHLRHRMVLC